MITSIISIIGFIIGGILGFIITRYLKKKWKEEKNGKEITKNN